MRKEKFKFDRSEKLKDSRLKKQFVNFVKTYTSNYDFFNFNN